MSVNCWDFRIYQDGSGLLDSDCWICCWGLSRDISWYQLNGLTKPTSICRSYIVEERWPTGHDEDKYHEQQWFLNEIEGWLPTRMGFSTHKTLVCKQNTVLLDEIAVETYKTRKNKARVLIDGHQLVQIHSNLKVVGVFALHLLWRDRHCCAEGDYSSVLRKVSCRQKCKLLFHGFYLTLYRLCFKNQIRSKPTGSCSLKKKKAPRTS